MRQNSYKSQTYKVREMFFVDSSEWEKELKELFYKVISNYSTFTDFYCVEDKLCFKLSNVYKILSIEEPLLLEKELKFLDENFIYFRSQFFINKISG